jgi:hypothetical protein
MTGLIHFAIEFHTWEEEAAESRMRDIIQASLGRYGAVSPPTDPLGSMDSNYRTIASVPVRHTHIFDHVSGRAIQRFDVWFRESLQYTPPATSVS